MKYDIEKGFLSKLLETKDMNMITDKRIKPYFFKDPEYKKAFKFLLDNYLKGGEIPSLRFFKINFPKLHLETYVNNEGEEVVGTEESLTHWCNQIRTKTKHDKLVTDVAKVVDELNDFETEQAYTQLKKTIRYIETSIIESSSVDITKDIENRIRMYNEREKNKGMLGIPTGIPKLDYIIKGLQDKQLITLIAGTGVGKTWLECIIGANAQVNGYRVLQFTTEMAEEQLQDRYEAVLFGLTTGAFNYEKFKSGKLSPKEKADYFKFLQDTLCRLEPLIIETATDVSSVSAKIDQYNPDLILIDGAYLMEDEQGAKDDWLRVAHITRDLKAIAKTKKKPIFINNQADSSTSKKTGPELGNISYSKAIGQDSDVVLSLFRDEYMIEDREAKIKVLKQREGVLGNVMINWDFTTMDFSSIYSDVDKKEENANNKQDEPTGVLDL